MRTAISGYDFTPVSEGMSDCTVLRGEAPGRAACYLKHGRDAAADELAAEHSRLQWLGARVSTATVLHFCHPADTAFLLTGAVVGRSALDCMRSEPAQRRQIITALARFLRKLHALPIRDCPFNADHELRLPHARRNIDAGGVDCSHFDAGNASRSAGEVWTAMLALLPLPFERVITHGDFTLDNVLLQHGRVSGCIDVGRAGIADPYQDLALLWRDLEEFGGDLQQHLFTAYDLPNVDEARLRFHLHLDEFF